MYYRKVIFAAEIAQIAVILNTEKPTQTAGDIVTTTGTIIIPRNGKAAFLTRNDTEGFIKGGSRWLTKTAFPI